MALFDKEEAAAESIAPTAAPVAPVAQVYKPTSVAKCTRDTRGEAPCAVKNCENCN